MTIFIDTGAFIARYIAEDQYHDRSIEIWQKIKLNNEVWFTSNHVLDETFTLLARRVSHQFSAEKAHLIYNSKLFQIVRTTNEDELAGLALFEKYADQSFSFTDCLSFVLMKRLKIQRAFSFDRHFSQAGFVLV